MRIRHDDAALLSLRINHGPALQHDLGQRDRFVRKRCLARLDQRQIENLVDQFQQIPSGLENMFKVALLGGRGRRCAGFNELCETENRVEWRAQFMAHAGKKIRFREIGFFRQ